MSKFYLFLWLQWILRVTLCSISLAGIIAAFVSSLIYIKQGMKPVDYEVFLALLEVFQFWFPIVLSITLLIALFRSLKYIFNKKIHGYKLILLECNSSETIEYIGYGDLIKVWRKWFMLMIWLVATQMIIAVAFTYIFTSVGGIMDWFNIYYLAFFIYVAGYFSFIILTTRCKRVKIVKC